MRKLESTVDLLEAMKELHGWKSDAEIARQLRVPQPTVATWRLGTRTPGDDHALLIAEALDISPLLVMAIAAGERARGKETQKVWRELATQIARGVVTTMAALVVTTGIFSGKSEAGTEVEGASSVYSVKRRKKGQDAAPTPAAA